MSKIKEYMKYKTIGFVLSELNQKEARGLGHLAGRTAEFTLKDTHRRVKTIIAIRAFARAFEDVVMAGASDKTKDELNMFKKEM